MMKPHVDKKWYFSHDAYLEYGWQGPFDTREQAGEAGYGDHCMDPETEVWVVEAQNPPVMLSEYLIRDFDEASERLYENEMTSEYDDDFDFTEGSTPEQRKELVAALTKVCDEWQAKHGIEFRIHTFSWMGKPERFVMELPPKQPVEFSDL